jgi:hypothetical protein
VPVGTRFRNQNSEQLCRSMIFSLAVVARGLFNHCWMNKLSGFHRDCIDTIRITPKLHTHKFISWAFPNVDNIVNYDPMETNGPMEP